ncbi:MAG: hypothetical protein AVDCRST_MAG26-2818, partial [uncultured Chloroflexia bacterium]
CRASSSEPSRRPWRAFPTSTMSPLPSGRSGGMCWHQLCTRAYTVC